MWMVTPLYGGVWPPQLFADGVRYVLPHYQRNYSWDVDQVSQFLQKLLVAVKTGYEELLAAVPAEGAIPKETLRDWPATQDAEDFGFMVLFQDPTEDGLYGVVDGPRSTSIACQMAMPTFTSVVGNDRESPPPAGDGATGDGRAGGGAPAGTGSGCGAGAPPSRPAVRSSNRSLLPRQLPELLTK